MQMQTQFLRRPAGTRLARRHAGLTRFAWIVSHRAFALLIGFMALVFLLGGGARADIQSLLLLRPVSALVLLFALASLRHEHFAGHRLLLGLAVAWLGLHLLQLVPLPPEIWQALPGRDIVAEIDRATGLGEVWRPLTMVPPATRNAAWALLAPLAVLVLGIQLDAAARERLLALLLSLALASALLGVLQLLGDPQGPLYFYRITNNGSAVGLLANRNHQAVFLTTVPPMLFAWAALRSSRMQNMSPSWTYWGCAAGGTLLVTPLILVTGSRSGLVTSLLGLLAIPALLAGRSVRPQGPAMTLLALAITSLGLLTVMLGQGIAFERLLGSDADDQRVRILGPLLDMIRLYSPWGSGFGSFTEIYELHEPRRLIAGFYMNHAHNDWLELALTGGWPSLALAAIAVVGWFVRLAQLLRPSGEPDRVLLGRLGLLILLMFAAASLGDYPLRTPALACLAVVAALWAAPPPKRYTAEASDQNSHANIPDLTTILGKLP